MQTEISKSGDHTNRGEANLREKRKREKRNGEKRKREKRNGEKRIREKFDSPPRQIAENYCRI